MQNEANAIADISAILSDNGISIDAMIKKSTDNPSKGNDVISVIIMIHEIQEAILNKAISKLEALDAVTAEIMRIRVAEFGKN